MINDGKWYIIKHVCSLMRFPYYLQNAALNAWAPLRLKDKEAQRQSERDHQCTWRAVWQRQKVVRAAHMVGASGGHPGRQTGGPQHAPGAQYWQSSVSRQLWSPASKPHMRCIHVAVDKVQPVYKDRQSDQLSNKMCIKQPAGCLNGEARQITSDHLCMQYVYNCDLLGEN